MNKKEIWEKYYAELHDNCIKCPNCHIQRHENGRTCMQTTYRCKAMATDHKDEYSRGYYPILDLGAICPMTNKQITSKTIGEVMKIVNNW